MRAVRLVIGGALLAAALATPTVLADTSSPGACATGTADPWVCQLQQPTFDNPYIWNQPPVFEHLHQPAGAPAATPYYFLVTPTVTPPAPVVLADPTLRPGQPA